MRPPAADPVPRREAPRAQRAAGRGRANPQGLHKRALPCPGTANTGDRSSMTTSNRKPPLAAALAVMPLVAGAGPPGAASAACTSDPYAGTRAADQALDTAQAADDTAIQ